MLNEDISGRALGATKTVACFVFRTTVLPTERVLLKGLKELAVMPPKAFVDHMKNPRGKMSIKALIGKDQGVQAVEISELGLRGFMKSAKRYGMDFAVVKSEGQGDPLYRVFFKARDQDAIKAVIAECTARQLKMSEVLKRPSLITALRKLRELVAATPHRVVEKRRTQER